MILFQYSKRRGLDVLESKRIMVTQPFRFNDPFEFRLAAEQDISREQAIDEIQNHAELQNDLFEFFRVRAIYTGRRSDFVHWFLQNEEALLPQLIDSFKEGIHIGIERIYGWETRIFGIACFTRRPNNILMWSHYAEGHEGILYVYDTKKLFPSIPASESELFFRPVKYSKSLVTLPPSLTGEGESQDHAFDQMVYTKSLQWKYEKEYRLVHLIKQTENPDEVGPPPFFIDIDPMGIKQVVFGCKCDEDTVTKTKDLVRREGFEHVVLKKAEIDKKRYKLNYKVIER